MNQNDIVLLIPMCNFAEIQACEDPISNAKELDPKTFTPLLSLESNGDTRPRHLCESAVPGACPRIQCFHRYKDEPSKDKYLACRMQGLIQSQKNESGFWMKLPCSQCNEPRNLHPTTEGFVHGEDTGPN